MVVGEEMVSAKLDFILKGTLKKTSDVGEEGLRKGKNHLTLYMDCLLYKS